MSKKKATCNTMTLKDFHGGSIPTDLPLPSAPGVIVRPSDRGSFDHRPTSWGIGRPDHRARPNSSPGTRHFDDKTPFLTHTTHMGRNFDEDERKPLDGVSAPRRTVSDDSIRVPPTRQELKPETVSVGRISGHQGLAPASQLPNGAVSSYTGRVSEGANLGVNSQNLSGTSGQGSGGSYPNAWAARKEVISVSDPVQPAWSGSNPVSKLAHASALEKVSSGRWQSKQSMPYQVDVEVIRYSEQESGFSSKGLDHHIYKKVDLVGERDSYDASLARHVERGLNSDGVQGGRREILDPDASLARHVERGLNSDGVQGGRREILDHERVGIQSAMYSEVKERNPTNLVYEVQPAHSESKFGGSELRQPAIPSEVLDRHKLKLVSRTKPLDSLESPAGHKQLQGYQRFNGSSHTETVSELHGNKSPAKANELHGNTNPAKLGLAGSENGNRKVDRPKLNLKPRSQPVEQLEGNIDRERNFLFGGARPRELVLKERGIDDVSLNNHDLGQPSDRVKHNSPRTETLHGPAIPSRNIEKIENLPHDRRIGKRSERKDHQVDSDRLDMQRKNWRNIKETEKKQQTVQQQERQPSPETWRKPVEQPKPASPDAVGQRHSKAASAVDLAQAFSRSVSDPKAADRFSGQRGLPGRTQMPFSRLTGPTPRPQINGY